ncbi:MAG: hypothetical protein IJY86_00325 [Clostridia bacterium]|nr:hypothetical protein [Clostridia bacterium]
MSQLLFLGTGAADWNIEDRGAGFFRRNSSCLVNGELMADCGGHVFDFAQSHSCPGLFDGVKAVLISHTHGDHFSPDSIRRIAASHPITVGGCEAVKNAIGPHENITFVPFAPFKEALIGAYRVMPVLANHHTVISGDDGAFHYVITCPDGKKLFYGLDGAWFLLPSWEEMKKHRFDAMIFDCTVGDSDDWRIFEHNTVPMLRMMIPEIKRTGMATDETKLIASHLARTLHVDHEHTSAILASLGMTVAFDGAEFEF